MDVQYTIVIHNTHLKDANVSAKVAAVDISAVESERIDDFVVHTNSTSIISSGTIHRVITATLTADFLIKFPTNDDKQRALRGAFLDVFQLNVPAFSPTETPILI